MAGSLSSLADVFSTSRLRSGLRLADAGKVIEGARTEHLKRNGRIQNIADYCYGAGKQHQAAKRTAEALVTLKRSQELGFSYRLLTDRLQLVAKLPVAHRQASLNLEENRRLLHASGLWPNGCHTLCECLLKKE